MPNWSMFPESSGMSTSARSNSKIVSHTAVPMMLNARCTTAARRALRLVPMEESMAVTQVPMFWPMMMGIAAPNVICPVEDTAWRIPTDAEED